MNTKIKRLHLNTSTVKKKLRVEFRNKWEIEYFSTIRQRLVIKLPISPNYTAMWYGNGKLKSYSQRIRIAADGTYTCNRDIPTVDHLLFECCNLLKERDHLKKKKIAEKNGGWPFSKFYLVHNFTTDFYNFCNSLIFLLCKSRSVSLCKVIYLL